MRHDETRDNTTAIENQSIEADAHADTREGVEGSDPTGRETWRERKLRLAIATFGPIRRSKPFMDDYLPEQEEPEDPEDPEHDPIGDAETDYDIEFEKDDEDDGQPSEYEEWQDYFGGDDYYDHSENEAW